MAIDQGTTSSRAIIFDQELQPLCQAQQELTLDYPQSGWVEVDPQQLWKTTLNVCQQVQQQLDSSQWSLHCIGITNQRETTIIWDRQTGEAIYPAIVWQDRRTASYCSALKSQGLEENIQQRTGLLLDPYFSASKIAWILDNVEGARARAENGELAFGTVDSYLLWQLSGGGLHATDVTNASRTSLFNISTLQWDPALLNIFNIPAALLPDVKQSSDDYGHTDAEWLGRSIPISGVAGDQQAASLGQGCLAKGDIKSTYGTGCFMMLNTGNDIIKSQHKLLSTIAYQIDGNVCYALEGSIFIAGAAIQWLRDKLKIIEHAAQSEQFAIEAKGEQDLYFIPAFSGLGAPHWQADARGMIVGITANTNSRHIAKAALEAIAFQTSDLITAMRADGAIINDIKVDGAMTSNSWFCQCLANLCQQSILRPQNIESTATGAAILAGLYDHTFSLQYIQHLQQYHHFIPMMSKQECEGRHQGWQSALSMLIGEK
ncbi:glycerol kinase GlpK [Alteromonadaceae bacterium BrNp21-10]|nr:glycerol kinase GlpK [Alteromonadaceae bacterium BrNp21-10]